MTAAPQVVQEAVTSPATQQVLGGLSKQYSLHIDVSGLLEKLTSYMLLGYVNPEQFLQEMRANGVADQQARQIIDEINKKIFVPLRAQMMNIPQAETKVRPPVPQSRPITPVSVRPIISATPPNVAPLPPKTVMPVRSSSTLGDIVRSVTAPKLLEDHEEPHIEFADSSVPANLPGMLPPQAPSLVRSASVPPKAESPRPAPPAIPVSFVKSYSNDPYRESVDETSAK